MGLIITSLRKEIKMSHYTLAKNAGIDYSWLRRVENGKSGIRLETFISIARGLQIPSNQLVTIFEKALEDPDTWLANYKKTNQD